MLEQACQFLAARDSLQHSQVPGTAQNVRDICVLLDKLGYHTA